VPMIKKLSVVIAALLFCQTVASAEPIQDKRLSFTYPKVPWVLTLPADDFEIAQRRMKDDGNGAYFYIVDEKQGLNVSMFIEPATKCTDSKSCSDFVWKAGNPNWINPQNVTHSQIGEVSIFELMVPIFQGMPIRQQNMYAQFVVDGFWVDMHISKVLYEPSERRLFERIVKSVKFEPKPKTNKN
jgi:hypothetical protein